MAPAPTHTHTHTPQQYRIYIQCHTTATISYIFSRPWCIVASCYAPLFRFIHALPMHDGKLNLLTNFTWNGRAQEALFLKEISTWSVRVVLSLLEDITVHPNRKKGGHVSPNPVKVMHHPMHHNGTMCSAFACGIYACPCHDQEATLSLYSLSVCGGRC